MTSIGAFLDRCQMLPDGFVALEAVDLWRLGSVMFARCENEAVMVRKAPVAGEHYQFVGQWALPGGMVRVRDQPSSLPTSARGLASPSLMARVRKETGLEPSILKHVRPSERLGPIVTSYTAKGDLRFTLLVVQLCDIAEKYGLVPDDRSVDAASWQIVPPDWGALAPGNRLAVAHLLWDELDAEQRKRLHSEVEDAWDRCSDWARTVGLPEPARPWDEPATVNSWRQAWPRGG